MDRLVAASAGRSVDALIANAGIGLGGTFLDQDFADITHVIDTNITVTLALIQRVAREMRRFGEGRILITGSIDSFSFALRADLEHSGVTVTCLMPGATDTRFFERAHMLDTRVGQGEKDDPADFAKAGFKAMFEGKGDIVTGWRNKLETAMANVTPARVLAERHRRTAEPGSGHGSEER